MIVCQCPLTVRRFGSISPSVSSFLDLGSPAFDAVSFGAHCDVELDLFHAFGVFHELVIAHASSVCSTFGGKIQHGRKEIADSVGFFDREVVLLSQDIRQRPVSKPVNIPELTLSIENFLRPLS